MATRSLGSLTLDLIAKIGGFEQGMGKAERRLDASMKRMERSVSRFTSFAKAAFFTIAGARVFGELAKRTDEQERAFRQLDAVMKSTGNAAGLAREEYISLAKAFQQTTRYGDETVLAAENILATFTQIRGNNFKQAIGVVLDMSTALGTDLKQSAIQVGKAINDPAYGMTLLTRVGVTFTDKQKKVIKALNDTGHVAEAQKVILDELTREFGGSAAAATDTFGGALDQLKNAFGDLLEGDGKGLNDATQSMRELTKVLQDPATVQGAQQITNALFKLASGAAKIVALVPNLTKFFSETVARSQGILSIDDPAGIEARNAAIQKELKAREGIAKGYFHRLATLAKVSSPIGGLEQVFGKNNLQAVNLAKKSTEELNRELDYNNKLLDVGNKLRAKAASTPAPKPVDPKAPGLPKVVDPKEAAKAAARAKLLAQAYDKLYTAVTKLQEASDPSAQAYAQYTNTVRSVTALAADAIAKGGDAVRVQNAVAEAVAAAKKQLEKDLRAPLVAAQEFNDALDEQLKARKRSIDAAVAAVGMSTREAQQTQELAGVYQEAADAIAKFQRQHQLHPEAMPQDQYEAELKALREYYDKLINITKQGQQRMDAARGDWTLGVKRAVDTFRDSIKDQAAVAEQVTTQFIDEGTSNLVDIVEGTKSAGKALKDFFSSLEHTLTTIIAKRLFQQLFDSGNGGAVSGNGSGGWLGGAISAGLSALFGGGRASGGPVQRGRMYEVNERGPEVLSVGGRDLLIMGAQSGRITAAPSVGSQQVTNNFLLQAPTEQRTQTQIAQRTEYGISRARRLS